LWRKVANIYGVKPQTGRFDANYGTTLLRNAQHQFHYMEPVQSGLFVKGEARDAKSIINSRGDHFIVVAINNDKLYLFRRNASSHWQ
jgi:hypothetical protein